MLSTPDDRVRYAQPWRDKSSEETVRGACILNAQVQTGRGSTANRCLYAAAIGKQPLNSLSLENKPNLEPQPAIWSGH